MIYYTKYPRSEWKSKPTIFYRSLKRAIAAIENIRAGYTSEPYIQLVQKHGGDHEVIAEWLPSEGRWLGPMQAAGFADVPGEWK